MSASPRSTRFYVDGFNLYYRALKGSAYKWLDLGALAQRIVPRENVEQIDYFTANVSDRPGSEGTAARQNTYFQALEASSVPVKIIRGQFKTRSSRMWIAETEVCKQTGEERGRGAVCACCERNTVKVLRTEEKGSDVNLAVSLVRDAFMGEFELAVVISNDSDMQSAINIVTDVLGLPVIVVNPGRGPDSLRGTTQLRLKDFALRRSQFKDRIRLPSGRVVHKPSDW